MASSISSHATSSFARTPSTSSVLSGDSNAASEETRLSRVFSIASGTPPYLSESKCFITFVVGEGEEAKTFTLHRDVICSHTQFFDTANKEKLKEGETDRVYMEDIEPHVFGLLFFWIYSGGSFLQRKVGERQENTLNQTPTKLAKLWVLANRLRMPQLQNAVIDEIFSAIEVMFRDIESLQLTGETHAQLMTPFIEYAYETEIAMIQDLAVDRLAFGCSESVFMDVVEFLPNHIVVDVAKALRAGIRMCAEDFYFAQD